MQFKHNVKVSPKTKTQRSKQSCLFFCVIMAPKPVIVDLCWNIFYTTYSLIALLFLQQMALLGCSHHLMLRRDSNPRQ